MNALHNSSLESQDLCMGGLTLTVIPHLDPIENCRPRRLFSDHFLPVMQYTPTHSHVSPQIELTELHVLQCTLTPRQKMTTKWSHKSMILKQSTSSGLSFMSDLSYTGLDTQRSCYAMHSIYIPFIFSVLDGVIGSYLKSCYHWHAYVFSKVQVSV